MAKSEGSGGAGGGGLRPSNLRGRGDEIILGGGFQERTFKDLSAKVRFLFKNVRGGVPTNYGSNWGGLPSFTRAEVRQALRRGLIKVERSQGTYGGTATTIYVPGPKL